MSENFHHSKRKMEIGFRNFAKAGTGIINLNDLTVICGPNNTGKTYINYAIFSVLGNMRRYFDIELEDQKIVAIIDSLSNNYTAEIDLTKEIENFEKCKTNIEKNIVKDIHNYFNVSNKHFPNLEISLGFDPINFYQSGNTKETVFGNVFSCAYIVKNNAKKFVVTIDKINKSYPFFQINGNKNLIRKFINRNLYHTLLSNQIRIPFAITSERTGISLFYKSFDRKNNENEIPLKHTESIESNINFIRQYKEILRYNSPLSDAKEEFESIAKLVNKLLDGGGYKSQNESIVYFPSNKFPNEPETPIDAASSSIKSTFLLDLFVNHFASKKRMLIIDEPELSLYPANQALMARLIAKLVNFGIKVVITTHSDFFIRELNNLITLKNIKGSSSDKAKIMKEFEYVDDELLSEHRVSAYLTYEQVIEKIEVDETGLNTKLLNSIIQEENRKSNLIYSLFEDSQDA